IVRFESFDSSGANCIGSGADSSLHLFGSDGLTEIKPIDDSSGIGNCAALVVSLNAGTFYIEIEETGLNASLSNYRLEIDFQRRITETENNDTTGTANDLF